MRVARVSYQIVLPCADGPDRPALRLIVCKHAVVLCGHALVRSERRGVATTQDPPPFVLHRDCASGPAGTHWITPEGRVGVELRTESAAYALEFEPLGGRGYR